MRIHVVQVGVALGLLVGAAHAQHAAVPLVQQSENGPVRKVQECGWFAIYSCSRSWREAREYAAAEGGRVLDSSSPEFPNFRPGWYCAALGPMSYDRALTLRDKLRYQYPDAYVKSSC